MKKILIFSFSLALITKTALATNYYVDCVNSISSDSNNGLTQATPWKTISHAQTSVAPGDTVHISSGNCGSVTFGAAAVSGQANNHIKYIGTTGTIFKELVFSPSGSKAYFIEVSNIKLAADYVPGTTCTGFNQCGAMVSFNPGTSDVVLKDTEVMGFIADDGYPASKQGIRFYGGVSNVTIDKLDMHTLNTVILAYGNSVGGETGNVIKNTKIHDVFGSAIGTFAGLRAITNTIISDEIPMKYYPTHAGGSGLAMRGGDITIDNVIIKNYGLTRPVRWYQGAGADGYQNVNISNLLVYYTIDGRLGYNYNKYVEIIHAGNNFNIINSTLTGGMKLFLADNNDGSGLKMYNNLISWLNLNSRYDTSSALAAQTCDQAFAKWGNVVENKNIFGALSASGGGYLCNYNFFSPGSSSIKTNSFAGLFINATQPNNDYRLSPTSQARNFGDIKNQAVTSMGHSLIDGFVVNGISRGGGSISFSRRL